MTMDSLVKSVECKHCAWRKSRPKSCTAWLYCKKKKETTDIPKCEKCEEREQKRHTKKQKNYLYVEQRKPQNTGCEMYVALDVAIKALEKQIPKKPTTDKVYKNGDYYVCPVCDMGIFTDTAYCSICGQALDWRDNE